MEQLRSTRRQWKGVVTRHLGTLERLVTEEDSDGVNERLSKMKKSFEEFESSHDAYIQALENDSESSEQLLSESEKWFLDAQKEYIVGVRAARAWLKSVEVVKVQPSVCDSDSDTDTVASARTVTHGITSSELSSLLNVPKVELDIFDGDPLKYQSFLAIFDEIVDSKISDGQIKLTRLLQYTSGLAKSSIRNCALIGGNAGYKQARDILKSRFGNSHLVSQKIIASLKFGNRVAKPNELQLLADELDMAVTALDKMNMYAEINTQQSIIDILQRCPNYVRNRWRKRALECKDDIDLYPTFSEFVEFMKLISSEASDPVYGMSHSKGSGNDKGARCANATGVSLNASDASAKLSECLYGASPQYSAKFDGLRKFSSCVVCGQNHRLFYCDSFKAMSPKSRFDIVKKNKLCFNCLLSGHGSRECNKKSVCSVEGCGRKHTKFIHIDNQSVIAPTSNHENLPENNATSEDVVSSSLSVSAISVYLPMVPVIVNGKYRVYALLDWGSTNTFITQHLASSLNLQGRKVNYMVNTLNRSANMGSKIVSINLGSEDGNQNVRVDNVLVVHNIPARYPSEKVDLNKYPHLSGLPIRELKKVQADLLIGMDNPHILVPYEVRSNPKDMKQPFATRTLFGWSLGGPLDVTSGHNVSSNFVDLNPQIERLWEMEANEEDVLEMSNEDQSCP